MEVQSLLARWPDNDISAQKRLIDALQVTNWTRVNTIDSVATMPARLRFRANFGTLFHAVTLSRCRRPWCEQPLNQSECSQWNTMPTPICHRRYSNTKRWRFAKFHRIRSWYSGALMWTVAVYIYICMFFYLFIIYTFIYLNIYLFIYFDIYILIYFLYLYIPLYFYLFIHVFILF